MTFHTAQYKRYHAPPLHRELMSERYRPDLSIVDGILVLVVLILILKRSW